MHDDEVHRVGRGVRDERRAARLGERQKTPDVRVTHVEAEQRETQPIQRDGRRDERLCGYRGVHHATGRVGNSGFGNPVGVGVAFAHAAAPGAGVGTRSARVAATEPRPASGGGWVRARAQRRHRARGGGRLHARRLHAPQRRRRRRRGRRRLRQRPRGAVARERRRARVPARIGADMDVGVDVHVVRLALRVRLHGETRRVASHEGRLDGAVAALVPGQTLVPGGLARAHAGVHVRGRPAVVHGEEDMGKPLVPRPRGGQRQRVHRPVRVAANVANVGDRIERLALVPRHSASAHRSLIHRRPGFAPSRGCGVRRRAPHDVPPRVHHQTFFVHGQLPVRPHAHRPVAHRRLGAPRRKGLGVPVPQDAARRLHVRRRHGCLQRRVVLRLRLVALHDDPERAPEPISDIGSEPRLVSVSGPRPVRAARAVRRGDGVVVGGDRTSAVGDTLARDVTDRRELLRVVARAGRVGIVGRSERRRRRRGVAESPPRRGRGLPRSTLRLGAVSPARVSAKP